MIFKSGLVFVFAIFLGLSHYLGYTPIALTLLFLLASGVAYYLYAKDKAAAVAGDWRVPENTLHTTALLFGWPGALIAQQRLRHKTRKQSFRTTFWLTVLLNLGGIAWLHSAPGNIELHRYMQKIEYFVVSQVTHRATVTTVLFLTRFRNTGATIEWATDREGGVLQTIGESINTVGEYINRRRTD